MTTEQPARSSSDPQSSPDRPAAHPDTGGSHPRRRRTKLILVIAGALIIIAGGIALALFEPWRLFTRSTVDEPLPVAVASAQVVAPQGTAGPNADPTPPATADGAPPADVAMALATGAFVDGEHTTTGTASVLQLADGSRYVRLENFSTSDGPDVHVWLTDQQAGGDDWGKYDDGRYIPLGELKATDGNQNYLIPADANLAGMRSVVIWCDRFNVAFGSAAIAL